MAKHVVLYSDYYLEEIQRQFDSASGIPSRGGRTQYGTVDPEEVADNRKQVISRSRKKVRQYVMHNFKPLESRMMTFTIRDGNLWSSDLKESVEQFRWFLKRLRRHLKKATPQYKLKYLYVAEFHENRHAIHFHMISDMPQTVISALNGIWGHGFVDSDNIIADREELVRKAGYLAKSFNDPRLGKGMDLFWHSRTVKAPTKVADHEADLIMDTVNTTEGSINVDEYASEYHGQTIHASWAFDDISLRVQLEQVNWT